MYIWCVPTGDPRFTKMQKVLLTVILALFVVISAMGLKRAVSPAGSTNGTVLVADGGEPVPPPTPNNP